MNAAALAALLLSLQASPAAPGVTATAPANSPPPETIDDAVEEPDPIGAMIGTPPTAPQPATPQPPAPTATPPEPAPGAPYTILAPTTPAYEPPRVRPFEMPAARTPDGPIPYSRTAPLPNAPVRLEEYRGSYEGAKNPLEQVYEAGVQGRFQAAQQLLGPLDGQWRLLGPDNRPLYSLLLNDSGGPEIEGAWRDLRAGPALDSTGFFLSAARSGTQVVLRFTARNASEPSILTLSPDAAGRWAGTLVTGQERMTVTLNRS